MSTKTTDFLPTLKATLHDVFESTWNKPTEYDKCFDVEDSRDAYEDELQIQGPDSVPQAAEGSVFEQLEIENVRSKRFTHLIYKAQIKVTKEAIADIKYKQCVDAVKKLAVAGQRTIERVAVAVLINGLNGSETTPDGLPLFSTAHVLSNPLNGAAATASNRAAADGQLSITNVRNMRTLGMKTVDEHGSLAPCMFGRLIVPPDLEDEAHAIKESALKPGLYTGVGGVNDKNTTGPKIEDITRLTFLAENPANASTQWFMRDDEVARNKVFWRVRPEKSFLREETSDDYVYRLYFRMSAGASDWRGLYGSMGTGATTAL